MACMDGVICDICLEVVAVGNYGHFGNRCQKCIDKLIKTCIDKGCAEVGCNRTVKCKGKKRVMYIKCRMQHISMKDVRNPGTKKQYKNMKRKMQRLKSKIQKCPISGDAIIQIGFDDFKLCRQKQCQICGNIRTEIDQCVCKFVSCFKCDSMDLYHNCTTPI